MIEVRTVLNGQPKALNNFENRSAFGEDKAESLVAFFDSQCTQFINKKAELTPGLAHVTAATWRLILN